MPRSISRLLSSRLIRTLQKARGAWLLQALTWSVDIDRNLHLFQLSPGSDLSHLKMEADDFSFRRRVYDVAMFPKSLSVIVLIAAAAVAGAQSVPATVGVVNGEVITDQDLGRSASGRIRMLTESREPSQSDESFERAKLAIRWEALNNLIERRLTRAEAARRMISEDDLLEAEIESRVAFPSGEMLEAFIEANRVRMPLIQGLSQREIMSQVGT